MPISTLIVDDTVTYRKILSEAAAALPELTVQGTASTGALALKRMAQTPADLVLLDIHMPDMDGVETLRRIRAEHPNTFVVMVSGISTRSAATTIAALEMGALDFVRKPEGKSPEESFKHLVDDLRPVVRLVEMRMQMRSGLTAARSALAARPASTNSVSTASKRAVPTMFGVVAIGVSTGGPEALNRLLPKLPADLPVPIVLVQHMPPVFTKSLAESLARKSKVRVVEASEGDRVESGAVYIAPGGRHMTVRQDGTTVLIGINDGPPENSCRPSVDVLFRSVASVYGNRGVLAAVLTGMGNDGCAGIRTLKRTACMCMTQSESSCVVYGMPRAVDEAGLSDASLPLDEIADEIVRRVKR